jgi:hypothetical protein
VDTDRIAAGQITLDESLIHNDGASKWPCGPPNLMKQLVGSYDSGARKGRGRSRSGEVETVTESDRDRAF